MTQQEVIKTFMESFDNTTLQGEAALDEAIKASSKSKFKSFAELRAQFLSDLKSAKNWHTFLVEKCGIILDNKDIGAISGSDAGGKIAKDEDNIFLCEGDPKYPEGDSFTVDGLTIYGIPPKEELTADQQYVVQGLYSWWIREALKQIKESYGLSYTASTTTNARLKLVFMDDEDDGSLASVNFDSDDDREYESRSLTVNMGRFKDMDPKNRHGKIPGSTLDISLMHELVHGLVASNILYMEDFPGWFAEGGTAELVTGIDHERYDEFISYMQNLETFEDVLTTKSIVKYLPEQVYVFGYIFMRYFAKQAGTDTTFDYDTYKKKVTVDDLNFATNYFDTVTMTGSKGNDTLSNSGSNVSIAAGKGNDVIKNYSGNVTVNGGSGKDSIDNRGDKITIYGGKGNDSVTNYSEGKKVSIDAGADKDFIINYGSDVTMLGGDGNDTIANYGKYAKVYGSAGNDFIFNNEIIDESTTITGIDATIYGGDGADTIKNTVKEILIYGQNDNDSIFNEGTDSTLYGGAGNDIIWNKGAKSKIYGGEGVDSIKNEVASISADGGKGNDKLVNNNDGENSKLSGGSGNDFVVNYADKSSIAGGSGNDTLYSSGESSFLLGDAGNDSIKNDGVKAYINGGAGKDKILNYGDHVTITGGAGNDKITNTGKHTVYEFGTGDGKDSVTGFNANDTVKITSGMYKSSQSGKNVIVKVGDATLTLKNAVGKKINFISASGKKTSKTYSAKLKKETAPMWFIDDDNFATSDNLSSIVKSKEVSANYSELELSSGLTKKNNLATFSGKKK